ncbi:hypothetical protein [Nocardia miyunensis]|uniref:hypothetical protein n=1 Tax=Nocardia miyunensis TaxID=282684 RepID=UPI000B01707A|nr:hypothetical protein [Nocardia miyunensis]
MKTTVEIADALLSEAREYAHQHGVALRTLLEEGLRTVLDTRRASGDFRLRDASVPGNGLQAEFQGASWAEIRDASYGVGA